MSGLYFDHQCHSDIDMGRKKKNDHLKWLYDDKTNQYTLNLVPLAIGVAWESKNKAGQFKWYGRIITTSVFDIENEFQDFHQCREYIIALLQSMFMTFEEVLFDRERPYEQNN